MAEENKSSNTAFEDMVITLFAILLVGQILQSGPKILGEHFGFNTQGGEYLVAGAALSFDTPLGTHVNAVAGTPYYKQPGSESDKLGDFPPGTSLVLADGPEEIDGERWWYVEDEETGKAGWVPESELVREGVGGVGAATKLGSKARALMDADLWEKPGGTIKAGFMKMGEWGEITKGPKKENGSRWWFFDRDDSEEDGWVTEAVLMLASGTDWREGTSVIGVHVADIYERAAGGQIVGLLSEGEKAKILGGPIEVGGMFWWFIETEEGERGWVSENSLEDGGVKGWFKGVIAVVVIIGTIVTLGLLGGIVYATIRTNQIRVRESERIKAAIPDAMEPKRNERWDKVQEHVAGDNPNDWRLAIIEADVMLDELITRMGYQGATLGERLKQIAKGDLVSLDAAWEAHKVRNQIAHAGSDFVLTQHEAKRVVDLYGKVFSELKYI